MLQHRTDGDLMTGLSVYAPPERSAVEAARTTDVDLRTAGTADTTAGTATGRP